MSGRKPSVLFVCVHNAGRSQMAAGYLRHLAAGRVEVRSAGSIPAARSAAIAPANAPGFIDRAPSVGTLTRLACPIPATRAALSTLECVSALV